MLVPEFVVASEDDCELVAPLTADAVSVVGVPPVADEDWVLLVA